MRVLRTLIHTAKPSFSPSLTPSPLRFGSFNATAQRRWKKPTNSAQTRLENRTRDLKLDSLMVHLRKLRLSLSLHRLMTARRRGSFVSVQLISRWNNFLGLNIPTGTFLRKYPHVFEVFTHPVQRNVCCRITRKMVALIEEENDVIREMEFENVRKIKKLLMMSVKGKLHIHALRLIKKELGLPENFRESIIGKYSGDFKLIDIETLALAENDNRDESVGICPVANVEVWREKEHREKWLSEFETKYAFLIKFPTGFKIKPGFRERLRNWQRLPYVKPYERREESVRVRTCGGIERFEKRAVAILHELLSLTVEKMLEVERLVHFKKDFGVEVNFRELILKHPGIFYISTKGSTQIVFLREAYCGDCPVEPNPVYIVRRKMLDLILLGRRNTRELRDQMEVREERDVVSLSQSRGGTREGDFVIPILEDFDDDGPDSDTSSVISG